MVERREDAGSARNRGRWWMGWGVCTALLLLPVVGAQVPPLVDLPQHVGQVTQLLDVLQGRDSAHVIQWTTPYSLVYLLLLPAVMAFGPLAGAKVVVAALAVGWTATVFGLARLRGRPLVAAAAASIVFFNAVLYWGMLQFFLGIPLFLWWVHWVETRAQVGPVWRRYLTGAAWWLVLYVCHLYLVAAAAGWLAVYHAVHRRPRLPWLQVGITAAPAAVLLALWYPDFAASQFDSPTMFTPLPTGRVSWWYLRDGVFGGMRGGVEDVYFGLLALYVAAGIARARRGGGTVDRPLAFTAALLWAVVLLAPTLYHNSILFSWRWVAPAVVCSLLAVPKPAIPQAVARHVTALAYLLVAGFAVSLFLLWAAFADAEYDGLAESLAALPPDQQVMYLDFRHQPDIKPQYLHTGAWAIAVRRAEMNFSFDYFGTSLVRRTDVDTPWSIGLEWFPKSVKRADFGYFSYVLVDATPAVHQALAAHFGLVRRTAHEGAWQLYEVPR